MKAAISLHKYVLVSLFALSLVGFARPVVDTKPPPKEERPSPKSTVAIFHDGTKVVGQIVGDKLEVTTKYGKLSVPLSDVLRIEFGLHYEDGEEARIKKLVGDLGSKSFREREDASATLLDLGVTSYLLVSEAVQSKDLEVKQRAEEVLKKIKEKYGDSKIRKRPWDVVYTAGDFTIRGTVSMNNFKIENGSLGAVALKPAQLERLQMVGGTKTLQVDANKPGWIDTGLDLEEGPLHITASGKIDFWPATPGQYTAGPNGNEQQGGAPNAKYGQLSAKVGDSGPFVVGESYTGRAGRGRLYLMIQPSGWSNNTVGNYEVQVRTAP